MSPFLQLIFALSIILLAAKAAGYLSVRLGQPSVLGELLAGLILGPSIINLLHWPVFQDPALEEIIDHVAEIGVLLLMFVAGLELHLDELAKNSKVSALAGVLGVLAPIGLGMLVTSSFGYSSDQSWFVGVVLGATSVSISAQTLIELKALRSRVGLGLLGAAVFDDILVILLLSTFLALASEEQGLGAVLLLLVRMVAFLALSVLFGLKFLPVIVRKVAHLPISQGVLTLALVVMFVYGLAAELLGSMAAITGTFLAGLMFARSPEKERLERGVSALAYAYFVPIFFVNIGLSVNARQLRPEVFWLFLAITLVAVIGKLVGAGAGARLAGYSWLESTQLGAGMISRGEVGLIIAAVGIEQGLLAEAEFSAIVGMILVTTLITPPVLRMLFSRSDRAAVSVLKSEVEED